MDIKKQQLKKHKLIATGLFILMAMIYVLMLILTKSNHQSWMTCVSFGIILSVSTQIKTPEELEEERKKYTNQDDNHSNLSYHFLPAT